MVQVFGGALQVVVVCSKCSMVRYRFWYCSSSVRWCATGFGTVHQVFCGALQVFGTVVQVFYGALQVFGTVVQVFGGVLQVVVLHYRFWCCALSFCGRYLWLVAG